MKKLSLCFLAGGIILSWAAWAQAVSVPYIIDLPAGFNQSMGRAINESDQVVGVMWYSTPPGPGGSWGSPVHPFAPFIFYGSGTAQALTGYLPGYEYNPQDLSNDGSLVVGYMFQYGAADSVITPWAWNSAGGFITLPGGAFEAVYAVTIRENEGNAIYGKGTKSGQTDHLLRWTLVGGSYIAEDLGEIDTDEEIRLVALQRNNVNPTNDHHSTTFISMTTIGYRAGVKGPCEVPEPSILILLPVAFLGLAASRRRLTR